MLRKLHLRLTTATVADTKIAPSVLSPLFPDTLPASGCRACRRRLRSQTFRPELSTLYPDTPPASACRARSERRSVGNLRLLFPSREDRHSPLRPAVGANRPFPPFSHPTVAADAFQSTPPAQYPQYHTIHNSPPLAPMVGTDEPLRSFRLSVNRYTHSAFCRSRFNAPTPHTHCRRCSVPCARQQSVLPLVGGAAATSTDNAVFLALL